MDRLARWVLSHRTVVVVIWIGLAVAGAATASRTVDALTYEFSLPGQPAYAANVQIEDAFGGGGRTDPLVLVGTTDGSGGASPEEFTKAAQAVAEAVPQTRVVVPADDGADALVSPDGDVYAAVVYPPVAPGLEPYAAAIPALEQAAAQASTATLELTVTGTTVLAETSSGGGDRGVLVEVLLGGLGALIVLALVFTSLLAGVPLLIAAVSILSTFLCLLGLTQITDVVFVVQYLVALIGLGVAIDYSLLIVMRWREERARGAENREAVLTAATTAGRSVLFSGVTVAVSLAALVAVPLPFLRSIGWGGLLIPLLSVATTLTLLPVILDVAGPRLQWPRKRFTNPRSKGWASIARFTVRHRWWVIAGTTAVLLALALPLVRIVLGSPQLSAYDPGTQAGAAADAALDAGIPPGVFRPTEVISTPADHEADGARARQLDGVAGAVAPAGDGWQADGLALVQVWSADDPATDAGRDTLDRVRATFGDDVGGTPAEEADFITAVYGNAPLVIGIVVLVTFFLLARALRSLWLPIKALALNIVSIAAAYGVTVWIWQEGHGSELLFGNPAAGAITIWVPIAAFAFLFGLSMDYEVFILARMREAYDEHGDTDQAVVDGIANTGRLVTSAALILFLSFVALSTVPSVETKILATTLALGIAIDAVIVRGLLAPALVAALGHYNWTMPRPLARLLRVR